MKIFLVEDNKDLNQFMTDTFTKIGYDTLSFCDGEKAFKAIEDFFDLYMIDINLPNINGFELVKKIKSRDPHAKIFIISGDDNIDTILSAYDIGCDDYIKKPFDLREVIAKINLKFHNKLKNQIKLTNDCYYDIKDRTILHKEEEITLTKKESSLLGILIDNIGKYVSNKDIELAVWGKNFENGHTRQLVSKLKKTLPCSQIIQNHSSNGYRIVEYISI